jgi:hypothetical protein
MKYENSNGYDIAITAISSIGGLYLFVFCLNWVLICFCEYRRRNQNHSHNRPNITININDNSSNDEHKYILISNNSNNDPHYNTIETEDELDLEDLIATEKIKENFKKLDDFIDTKQVKKRIEREQSKKWANSIFGDSIKHVPTKNQGIQTEDNIIEIKRI